MSIDVASDTQAVMAALMLHFMRLNWSAEEYSENNRNEAPPRCFHAGWTKFVERSIRIDDDRAERKFKMPGRIEYLQEAVDKVLYALRAECDYLDGRTGQYIGIDTRRISGYLTFTDGTEMITANSAEMLVLPDIIKRNMNIFMRCPGVHKSGRDSSPSISTSAPSTISGYGSPHFAAIKEETASPSEVIALSPAESMHKAEMIDFYAAEKKMHYQVPDTSTYHTIPSDALDFPTLVPDYTWLPQEPRSNMGFQATCPLPPSALQPVSEPCFQGLDLSFPFPDMTAATIPFGGMQQPGSFIYPFCPPISQSEMDQVTLYTCMAQPQSGPDNNFCYDGPWMHPPMVYAGGPQAVFSCSADTPSFPAVNTGALSPSQIASLYIGQPPGAYPDPCMPSILLEGQGQGYSPQ